MGLRERAGGLAVLLAVGCGGGSGEPSTAPRTARTEHAGDAVVVAPVPLRRLTREEYDHTVRDLLGDTSRPARAFPPDETIGGFETNTIAPATTPLVERYQDAAEAVAASAVRQLDAIAPCPAGKPHEHCAEEFIERFGRRAYRRPLDDAERATLFGVYADKAKRAGYAGGIQLVIEALLQSPQFLYRVEAAAGPSPGTRKLDGYELATRLSYFIWASTPDDALLEDAAAGRLSSPADLERVARRMLKDPRAVDGLRSFHRQWLGLRELETAQKDGALGVTFTPELKDAMVEETLRFSVNAVQGGGDAVTTLLTSNKSYVNGALAKLYGVPAPAGGGFSLVDLPPQQRAGVLTHASVMSVLAAADQPSPVLRGKFVRERLLCQVVPPPPPNAVFKTPKVDPTLTTKQRFAQHRTDPSCASCHEMMDPIGFGFEHYDAIGAWRASDGAYPVDAVGELSSTDGLDGSFDGAVALGARLAGSEQVRRCLATQWLRFALGRTEREEDEPSLAAAYDAFARAGFDVRELIVAITKTPAFGYTRIEGGGAP